MRQPPPPPRDPTTPDPGVPETWPDDEDRIHVGAALLVLLGLAAWIGAAGGIAGISGQQPDTQITYLAAAIALSVAGATFLIVAVLISNHR